MSGDRHIEYIELSALKSAVKNPKKHSRDLAKSLQRFGYADAVILDERTGLLVAGHGRVEHLKALAAKGAPPPDGVADVPGNTEWTIPVQRGWSSKNDAEAAAFLVAHNRIGEQGGWDHAGLDDLVRDLATQGAELIDGIGVDVDEILRGLDSSAKTDSDTEPEEGAGAAVYVKAGELWKLGTHEVYIGDATDDGDVARLFSGEARADAIITDPPYAIYGSSSGIGADIADDKMVRPFFEAIGRLVRQRLRLFGHAYSFTDWRSYPALWEGFKRAGDLTPRNALVWDKGDGGLGSMWAQCYELIAFFVLVPPAKSMSAGAPAGHRQVFKPNVLRFNRPTGEARLHNAAKPVALLAELVEASTDKGQTVFDPFCGSGSTLIACENTGRRCLTMEIEPRTAQVAIDRWQRHTGRKAERT